MNNLLLHLFCFFSIVFALFGGWTFWTNLFFPPSFAFAFHPLLVLETAFDFASYKFAPYQIRFAAYQRQTNRSARTCWPCVQRFSLDFISRFCPVSSARVSISFLFFRFFPLDRSSVCLSPSAAAPRRQSDGIKNSCGITSRWLTCFSSPNHSTSFLFGGCSFFYEAPTKSLELEVKRQVAVNISANPFVRAGSS